MKSDNLLQLEGRKRREYLRVLLSCGALGLIPYSLANASWFSSSPEKMAADKSIYSLEGVALVNGQPATLKTRIRAGDRIQTRADSELIFVVGADSFVMRSNSEMEIGGSNYFIDSLRLLSGKLLSVFDKRKSGQVLKMQVPTATIGIRGTGIYVEAEPDLTYVCTCYGQVALASRDDPNDTELISTKNHDDPRYISRKPDKGTSIRLAPVINHSDAELKLLEAIVGRKVPKGFGKNSYKR